MWSGGDSSSFPAPGGAGQGCGGAYEAAHLPSPSTAVDPRVPVSQRSASALSAAAFQRTHGPKKQEGPDWPIRFPVPSPVISGQGLQLPACVYCGPDTVRGRHWEATAACRLLTLKQRGRVSAKSADSPPQWPTRPPGCGDTPEPRPFVGLSSKSTVRAPEGRLGSTAIFELQLLLPLLQAPFPSTASVPT